MRRAISITLLLSATAFSQVSAQQPYSYTVQRTIPINWLPETKDVQRYTVAVNPFYLVNSGLKFDFEYELGKPGRWIQTSLIGYIAPHREGSNYWRGGYDGNNRSTFNSGLDYFHNMWGIGTSAMYKHMWHRRGWYFNTGLVLEYYSVGRIEESYTPYVEDGLRFYRTGSSLYKKSFVKPTAQFNIGKHMAISRMCFFDMYIGVGFSYSIYNRGRYFGDSENYYGYSYYDYYYHGVYGFARRGFSITGGFRFGVLLWDKQ